MNQSMKVALKSKVGMSVIALNPATEKWERGYVTGTYHRERIGDFDIGLIIDFGDGVKRRINQKHCDEETFK